MAVKGDGKAVVWGSHDHPDEVENFRTLLQPGVKEACVNAIDWALILRDGSLAVWPRAGAGLLQGLTGLHEEGVVALKASLRAFAALKEDGTAFAWGTKEFGGDTSEVHNQLTDVTELHSCTDAFAAVRRGGQVVFWGGASKELLKHKLRGDINEIYTQGASVAAVFNTGYLQCGTSGRHDPVPSDLWRPLRSGVDDRMTP